MKFVVLGLLVVFVIGFFVVVWKAAPHWRWYHIVAAIFTMLLTVVFLFPTAGVLKSRSAWHQVKERLEKQADQAEAQLDRLKYGDPENPEAGQGIIRLSRLLSQMSVEAGRRWRNLQLQNVADQSITLSEAPQVEAIPGEPVAPVAANVTQPLIAVGQVVYGFAETGGEQQMLLPTLFLGEFLVTASTPTTVTIEPTAPLEEVQLQAIQNRQATSWSLYELLPIDGHSMFIAEGSVPSDENFLGRVDEELVRRLLGDRVSAETLQSYLRDGSRATPQDPPLSRWTKIEFDKNKTYDVDAEGQQSAIDGGYFDGVGRAVDARLQKGEPVEFKQGEQIIVKEEEANLLIDEGTAHLVDQYFVRPLNDYRYILPHIRMRLTELANRMQRLKFEQQVLKTAADKTQQMLVVNQELKLKLEQDFEQFRTEKRAIAEYTETLRGRAQQMRAEMKRLHQENIALEKQLSLMHRATDKLTPGVAAIQ